MSLQSSDAEAGAVAVAPRVSLADIEAAIKHRFDTTAEHAMRRAVHTIKAPWDVELGKPVPELALLSICVLVMRNAFVVIGKSAPASAANFNAELGKKLAYEDCIRQLWPLMGFALRDRLSKGEGS